MRNINMSYYNVYYYCNIIDNLLRLFVNGGVDYANTAAQFTEPYFEEEPESFPRYSALHDFCDFVIRRLMFEDSEKICEAIQETYDSLDEVPKDVRLQQAFYSAGLGKDSLMEIDCLLKMYNMKHQTFLGYLLQRDFDDILDEYSEFMSFDEEIDTSIVRLSHEVFYILFKNREFLYRFNSYLASVNPHRVQRGNIPQWVKRAVKYRDRGKCVCCRRDLSGELDCEDAALVHFDHMVSLHSGGLNDVSNIQLLCQKCNLEKSSDSYTSNIYKDWYDCDFDLY